VRTLLSTTTSTQRTATITLFMKKMPRCKQWHPISGSKMENKNKINSKKRPIPLTMLSMKILRMKRTKMILKRQTILMKKKK
jgi:hypothetical protein